MKVTCSVEVDWVQDISLSVDEDLEVVRRDILDRLSYLGEMGFDRGIPNPIHYKRGEQGLWPETVKILELKRTPRGYTLEGLRLKS